MGAECGFWECYSSALSVGNWRAATAMAQVMVSCRSHCYCYVLKHTAFKRWTPHTWGSVCGQSLGTERRLQQLVTAAQHPTPPPPRPLQVLYLWHYLPKKAHKLEVFTFSLEFCFLFQSGHWFFVIQRTLTLSWDSVFGPLQPPRLSLCLDIVISKCPSLFSSFNWLWWMKGLEFPAGLN